jgi:pyrroloquinoline-quinone synthase
MLAHYDFVTTKTMGYFKRPLDEAPRDAIFPLGFAKQNAKTAASARLSVKR